MRKQTIVPLIAALLLAGATAGCAPAEPSPRKDGTPEFSGPYAEEFRKTYEKTTDPELRAFLEDGKITEAESQAVVERLRTCLAEHGITLVRSDENSSEATLPEAGPARENAGELLQECGTQSGEFSVLPLYYSMKQDPQKQITTETLVACLVRAGVVPEGFTVKDYESGGIDAYHPPEVLYEPAGAETLERIKTCHSDPLGSYVD
ncbi:hypothetical protein [Leucobacter sp. PH1c]|uniref:hypothetical protein n=1 Tax=Leucobacter sp. PH1c TaxID=1397278 RepID=UPI00046A9698|nr:hypothetical protein [Leucobacter sp. PH1c]